jgi:Flp pilus assembly protein TadG
VERARRIGRCFAGCPGWCARRFSAGAHALSGVFKGADSGAITAEFAVVLPAVMMLAVLLMMCGRAVTVSMGCQDAASVGARTAVVSASDVKGRRAAKDAAGSEAKVDLAHHGSNVVVTVSCPLISDPLHVMPNVVVGKATGVMQ